MPAICRAFAVLWLCLCSSIAVAQQQVQLSPAQVLQLSVELLNNGQLEPAARLAQGLLDRDPDDLNALLVMTRIAEAAGDRQAQLRFARRGYWASNGGSDSFVFARNAANALAAQQYDTRSQVWLRRARQYAPDEATSQAVARDYQALRQRNPWSTTLNFAVTPSTNINNGTLNQTAQVLGFPFEFTLSRDAQPLSGLQISGGFNTRYRFYGSRTAAAFVDIDAFGRTYALSQESKDEAPDAKGSDYSDASAGIGLTYRTILSDNWAPTQVGVRFGKSWYAGDPYTDTIDLTVSQPVVLSDTDRLTFVLSSQVRTNENDDPWVQTRRVRTSWDRTLQSGDQLGLSFSISEAVSDDIESDYDGAGLGVTYGFGRTFEGIAFSGALDFERKDYDANVHEPGARTDDTLRLRLFARLTEVEYYGFQPVLTFDARQTKSNVTFYDNRNSYNFGFDLRSSF